MHVGGGGGGGEGGGVHMCMYGGCSCGCEFVPVKLQCMSLQLPSYHLLSTVHLLVLLCMYMYINGMFIVIPSICIYNNI